MYVAKLNDLYLKKIDVENFYNGTKSINGQFTNSFRKAALFNDCDDEDVELIDKVNQKNLAKLEMIRLGRLSLSDFNWRVTYDK